MKKLLLTLLCILSLSSWHANAQSTCENNFTQSGTDAGPTVLTINASDLDCNGAQSIISLKLTNAAGNLTNTYCSTSGGGWYSFDLDVDGVVTSDVCASQINDVDISGFTTLSIVSKDNDNWTDSITITIDVEVTYTTPSCVNPTATISDITGAGATATWAAANGAASYDWEVVPTGNAQGTGVIDFGSGEAGLTASITGLTGNTEYDFLISSDCDSDYAIAVSFTTTCDGVLITEFPWGEDFSDSDPIIAQGYPYLPACWTTIDNNVDNYLFRGYSDVGTDGAWGLAMYTYPTNGSNDDYLVLPQFSLPTDMTLSYQVKSDYGFSPYWNDYKVLLSTTGIDPADFTEELLPLTVVTNTTYATQTIDLSAYSGDVYIAMHIPAGGNRGYYLKFDEFQIFETPVAPLCAVNLSPADGETDLALTGSAVNLSWEANPLGETPTGYKVYYGSDPSSISLAGETTDTSVNITSNGNLPGATMYYKIVPTNNGIDATGCDVIEFVFASLPGMTCDDPITVSSLPYSETAATTVGFYDNYSGSPGTACTTSSYLNGNDIVYAYTATANTYVTIDLTNITDTYTGVFIYENCSDIGSTCVAGDTSGSSTDDLKIENFAMVGGDTYYIVMSTWASPQTTTFDLSIKESVNWTGTTSSDWADVSNWSTGAIPTSSDIVAIDGTFTNEPSISSTDAVAKTVIVTTGNTLTIDETSSLTVSGDFTNTGTVTLNSTEGDFSSLIVTGTATGDITYNRYVNAYDTNPDGGGWDFVCSPVTMSIADFITANGTPGANVIEILGDDYAFASYDNAAGQWNLYATDTSTGSFTTGQGYAMATNAGDGATVAFTGAMQTADQSIDIINNNGVNGVGRRWNLVSNPFPSYINGNTAAGATNFMDANAAVIDDTFLYVYGWNGSSYTIYNQTTDAFSMAPGQAFWVAAENTTATALNFTAAMRTTTGTGDFVAGPQPLTYNVELILKDESQTATTNFYFKDGLSLDLDPGYDAAAFNQSMALSTRLPQGSQETAFGINAMGMDAMQNTRVPLEIRQNAGEAFTISIADMELPEDIYVYLEDTLNGTLTSLKDGDFELVAQSNLSGSDRFFIVFKSNSVLSNGDTLGINALNVYKANTDSFVTIAGISPELGKLNVSLYNILGQTVREKALSSATATQTISTDGLASGLYIVQIRSGNQTTVKKIIVK
jgi:hypothetical protein